MIQISAIARGRVQGVGYRYFVTGCAHKTGVLGYVRNMTDGSVLIVAQGTREAIDVFTSLIRAEKDPYIRVDELTIARDDPTGEFSEFSVRW